LEGETYLKKIYFAKR